MKSLESMSILVTGGGSGIGLGTARYCIESGAKVTICGRLEDKIQAAATELGDACHGVTADITVAADRQKLLEAAIDHGGQLDALINNAGNMYRGAITELDETALQEVFHTNVIAAMMLTGVCTPSLAQQQGAVVFVGSIHTRRAFPGASPYAATKAAVQGLPRVLHALGRIGSTEEIAEAMAYLICAEWVTGAMIDIDGGLGLGITADPAINQCKETSQHE